MRITKIHDHWGSILEVSGISELLSLEPAFLSELGYSRDLIVIRGIGLVSDQELYALLSRFGKPWSANDYRQTTERPYEFEIEDGDKAALTVFSNLTACRLGTNSMPWHADIPLNGVQSFPWRSLYIVNNPNPESGITEFMNIRVDLVGPSESEYEKYKTMTTKSQSWYKRGEQDVIEPFIKVHPVTSLESLRLNHYVDGPWSSTAWIKEVFVDGVKSNNISTLGPILGELANRPELNYKHKWQTYDLIIYDNWNFVHKRTKVDIAPGQERKFIRANIHHVTRSNSQ